MLDNVNGYEAGLNVKAFNEAKVKEIEKMDHSLK